MNRTDPQFKLRIPVELKETLDAKADENSRSLSNEMLKRLEVTIELDELLAVSGGFIYAAGVLANLIKENQALKSERDEFRSLVKSEFSKLLDERIDLLESRLLSLPGSSFGKAVAKTKT
ncbi:Arc family DNA-binding protein [Pseudomonas lundensis]|nr:Arc family DNA-binding protein [Pseudomonas lundensis]